MMSDSRFTFLPKSEQSFEKPNDKKQVWVIDQRKFLSIDEVIKLRKFCLQELNFGISRKNFRRIRDYLMIELGLNAGLRVSEMAGLKHCDIFIDESRSFLIVNGKGKKIRPVSINFFLAGLIEQYINYKTVFGFSCEKDSFLLNNRRNKKISKRSLQKSFSAIIVNSGLPSHYSIHCLRHTYATFLLKASNYNFEFVRRQLGHSSIKTTQIYAGLIDSENKAAVERLYI